MYRLISTLLMLAVVPAGQAAESTCAPYLSHEMRKLRSSETIDMCAAFAGRPMLVVNTASHCGFTYQFEGLEALHQAYKDTDLVVVGVPSNDFRQAAKSEEAAAKVCYVNYGVTFTMLSPQRVKGRDAHPMFKELNGAAGEPTWNFNKYLIDRDGNVLRRFDSNVNPMSPEMRSAVEAIL